jgi:hypothetical protein
VNVKHGVVWAWQGFDVCRCVFPTVWPAAPRLLGVSDDISENSSGVLPTSTECSASTLTSNIRWDYGNL